MSYSFRQALDDANSLPKGQSLKLTFALVTDAARFRTGMIVLRKRDREVGGLMGSKWDGIGTRIIKSPDGSCAMEIGRWDGKIRGARQTKSQPTKIEVIGDVKGK